MSFPLNYTTADHSGTIASGGVSQVQVAASPQRSTIKIQNLSTHDLWINFGAAATAGEPSLCLAGGTASADGNVVGGYYEESGPTVSRDSINLLGGTTSQAFTCKVG